MSTTHDEHKATRSTYVIGFTLSVLLTLIAYVLVSQALLYGWALMLTLAGLAVWQLCVQLFYFLHIGSEQKPRFNTLALLFAVMVVVIVVFGTLWIMKNLDYHDMTPQETNTYIQEEEAIRR
jgi:cytochrome o ubiquinol oxidase subunit IV